MVDWPNPKAMKLRHYISRAHWKLINPAAFAKHGTNAGELERVEFAIAMLWPLAREVFLLHRINDLSYAEIADLLRIEISTVEICIADALLSIRAARRGTFI